MPRTALPAVDSVQLLVEASRDGDLRAWQGIVRGQQELVFRSVYLATRGAPASDEATQTAFIRAYRALSSLEAGAALRPWLMKIAIAVARAQQREMAQRREARIREPHRSPRLPATPMAGTALLPAPTPLEHDASIAAFDRLGDDDRLLIASRYLFGLSNAEAAVALGIPSKALDDRLSQALRRVRKVLTNGTMSARTDGSPHGPSKVPLEELPEGHFATLDDDVLALLAIRAVMSEVPWVPDVAPAVTDRLVRDALAYPAQLARMPR